MSDTANLPTARTHFLPRDLKLGEPFKGSKGIMAFSPNGTLYLFVHGFNGSAASTWNMFPELLMNDSLFANSDLVFLQYESLKTQARANAGRLYTLLQKLASNPVEMINESLPSKFPRENSFKYKKISLVGHSLGAVLCRQALLDACKNKEPWASTTDLTLFAPAHMGSHLNALLKETVYHFVPGQFLGPLVSWHYQVISDLEPDSQFLRTLKDASSKYATTLKAKKIVHGMDDHVVRVNDFLDEDPTPIFLEGKGHTTVCKPNSSFKNPLEIVRDKDA